MIPAIAAHSRAGPPRRGLLARFWRDVGGAGNPIEFAVVLPLFVLLLFGIYQVWEITAIKESLDRGVLQAAEYWSTALSGYGTTAEALKNTSDQLIVRSLENNSLLRARARAGQIEEIDLSIKYLRYDVKTGALWGEISDAAGLLALAPFETFLIEARLAIPWIIELPLLPPQRITIQTSHIAFKERPFQWPPPTATPPLPGP